MPDGRHVGAVTVDSTPTKVPLEPLFVEHLSRALPALYDPGALAASPLIHAFGLADRIDPVSDLQRLLIRAIEALGPSQGAPRDSRAWRIHQILRRRYVEQLTQRQVAADLALSRRQLQREEKAAREILAAHLWTQSGLASSAEPYAAPDARPGSESAGPPSLAGARAQELAHLSASVQAQATDLGALVHEVLETIGPLLRASSVSVVEAIEPDVPPLLVQASVLRQALLNAITAAVHGMSGGQLQVAVSARSGPARITVRAAATHPLAPAQDRESAESLEIARALVQLLGGTTQITTAPGAAEGAVAELTVTLPPQERLTVLVIDDNVDALRLAQRYLHGSRYHFVGTHDPTEGLEFAQHVAPQVIVLDVMMPEHDGWMLLGQLREHPATRGTPVIVCTVLAQEELAMALGAADFIRKPVSRADFLAALDRQVAAPAPTSR